MNVALAEKYDLAWVSELPELDDFQCGALRRMLNLSRLPKGDWSGMMGESGVMGEGFGAYRFQLAYMAYALALTHVHRLPNAPAVFHEPFDRLIQKILHPDCWIYWSNVSTGNGIINKPMGKLEQRWDPVAEDNIMYSAYVQSMALMYHYLFRDEKYARPGSLTINLQTVFWHEEGFTFPYDEKSINEAIYWQMAERGFLGVACEPGCIFQVCNQPNIMGFRFHDLIYGTDYAGPAMEGYLKAWGDFGFLVESGDFQTLYLTFLDDVAPVESAKLNFWLMALLHSWYPSIVEEQFPVICERYLLDGPDGTKWMRPKPVLEAFNDSALPAAGIGWAACAAAEVGDQATLDAILRYADKFLNPVWEDGAYYYKRRDQNFNEDDYYIGMDPHTGNALFGYARLNVKDGLKKLFDGPWDDRHFDQPALVRVPEDVDVRRAVFNTDRRALVITLGALAEEKEIGLAIRVPKELGRPRVIRDEVELDRCLSPVDGGFALDMRHKEKTTLVFQW